MKILKKVNIFNIILLSSLFLKHYAFNKVKYLFSVILKIKFLKYYYKYFL